MSGVEVSRVEVPARECGECHPQVARGQQPQLPAQAPGRAAVVGDGDDGRHGVGEAAVDEQPQGRECRVQAVAAAERDGSERPVIAAHSRPRSRCVTRTAKPSVPASRRPSSSLIATLRCLPPVQPTASVR